MKFTLFIFFLMFLFPFAYSSDFYSAISDYVEPNLSVQIIPLNTSAPSAIVLMEGEETMVVKGGEILENTNSISLLLREHIFNSANSGALMASVNSNVSELSFKHNASDVACSRLTGLDHLPCIDRETCVRAAFSNPNAAILVNADGFWEAMLDWRIKNEALEASIEKISPLLASLPNSSQDVATIRLRLAAIRGDFLSLHQNHLYLNRTDLGCTFGGSIVCYEYCPKANWSLQSSNWMLMESQLEEMENSLNSLPNQSQRALEIINRTSSWKDYSRQKASIWAGISSELSSRLKKIESKLHEPVASKYNDTSLNSDYASYLNEVNATLLLASDGKFYRAIARKDSLYNQSDILILRIDANNKKSEDIQNRFSAISLSVLALNKTGVENESVSLAISLNALESNLSYPLSLAQLEDLDNKSKELEILALSKVARLALGAPSQDYPNLNSSVLESQNTTLPISETPSSASNDSNPISCPLPLAFTATVLFCAFILSRN